MSQDKKVVAETKLSEEEKLFEEKNAANPYIAGFIESMAKSNTEKITKEILEGLSEDTGDSDDYDAENGGEDSEDRPWRPSHTIFGKSTIKQSHLDNMRGSTTTEQPCSYACLAMHGFICCKEAYNNTYYVLQVLCVA
jgi:hypothetical protein